MNGERLEMKQRLYYDNWETGGSGKSCKRHIRELWTKESNVGRREREVSPAGPLSLVFDIEYVRT